MNRRQLNNLLEADLQEGVFDELHAGLRKLKNRKRAGTGLPKIPVDAPMPAYSTVHPSPTHEPGMITLTRTPAEAKEAFVKRAVKGKERLKVMVTRTQNLKRKKTPAAAATRANVDAKVEQGVNKVKDVVREPLRKVTRAGKIAGGLALGGLALGAIHKGVKFFRKVKAPIAAVTHAAPIEHRVTHTLANLSDKHKNMLKVAGGAAAAGLTYHALKRKKQTNRR